MGFTELEWRLLIFQTTVQEDAHHSNAPPHVPPSPRLTVQAVAVSMRSVHKLAHTPPPQQLVQNPDRPIPIVICSPGGPSHTGMRGRYSAGINRLISEHQRPLLVDRAFTSPLGACIFRPVNCSAISGSRHRVHASSARARLSELSRTEAVAMSVNLIKNNTIKKRGTKHKKAQTLNPRAF